MCFRLNITLFPYRVIHLHVEQIFKWDFVITQLRELLIIRDVGVSDGQQILEGINLFLRFLGIRGLGAFFIFDGFTSQLNESEETFEGIFVVFVVGLGLSLLVAVVFFEELLQKGSVDDSDNTNNNELFKEQLTNEVDIYFKRGRERF